MKKASYKQLFKLTECVSFYWSDIIRDNRNFADFATKYCMGDALSDISSNCEFWYSGRVEYDWHYLGGRILSEAKEKGWNVAYFDEQSEFFDSALFEELKIDLTRAWSDCDSWQYEKEISENLEYKILDEIAKSDCDYWAFTKTDKQGNKTECEFWESDSVSLGYTAKNQTVAQWVELRVKFYDLLDSRWCPCPDIKEVINHFFESCEIDHELTHRESQIQSIKAQYCFESTLQGA